jgi:hypothetical protein
MSILSEACIMTHTLGDIHSKPAVVCVIVVLDVLGIEIEARLPTIEILITTLH